MHPSQQPSGKPWVNFSFQTFEVDLIGLGMRAKAEIFSRQQIEMIHHVHDVRGADLAHLVLRIVQVGDFLVDALPRLADERHICHAVLVAAHVAEAADDRGDLLITEDASRAAATGLFEARLFAADVIPRGVDRCDSGYAPRPVRWTTLRRRACLFHRRHISRSGCFRLDENLPLRRNTVRS